MSDSKSWLDVIDYKGMFRIAWFEDYDEGAMLGQSESDGQGNAPKDRDAWEHWTASKAVRSMPGVERDSTSFYWESLQEAKAALRAAKAALKGERELPEWAKTALADGWKIPEGVEAVSRGKIFFTTAIDQDDGWRQYNVQHGSMVICCVEEVAFDNAGEALAWAHALTALLNQQIHPEEPLDMFRKRVLLGDQ